MTKRAREEPSGDDDGAAAAASSAPSRRPRSCGSTSAGAFITTRSTLCAVPGSMLAVKFQVPNCFGPPLMDEMGAVFPATRTASRSCHYLRRGRLIGAPRDGLLERVRDDAEYRARAARPRARAARARRAAERDGRAVRRPDALPPLRPERRFGQEALFRSCRAFVRTEEEACDAPVYALEGREDTLWRFVHEGTDRDRVVRERAARDGPDRGHAFGKSDAVDAEQVKNTLWRLTTTGIRDDNFMAFEGVVSTTSVRSRERRRDGLRPSLPCTPGDASSVGAPPRSRHDPGASRSCDVVCWGGSGACAPWWAAPPPPGCLTTPHLELCSDSAQTPLPRRVGILDSPSIAGRAQRACTTRATSHEAQAAAATDIDHATCRATSSSFHPRLRRPSERASPSGLPSRRPAEASARASARTTRRS